MAIVLTTTTFVFNIFNAVKMGKACRVKKSTQTHRKRKGFMGNGKKMNNDADNSTGDENIVNNDQSIVNSSVNTNVSTSTQEKIPTPSPTTTPISHLNTVPGSQRKVTPISKPSCTTKIDGYRIIDVALLEVVFKEMRCPDCLLLTLSLQEMPQKKKGLSSYLFVKCKECEYEQPFYTSQACNDKTFDVNKRIVYAMTSCGQGHAGIDTFTTLMNIPKPMTLKNYNVIVKKFVDTVKEAAEETMQDACEELHSLENTTTNVVNGIKLTDATISLDGSWQRRGHTSLNGCVTAISMETGKIVDVEAMSRYCKACSRMEETKISDPAKYDSWKANHDCNFNYRGSAGGMEVVGAMRIFGRSIEKRKLRYNKLVGDGDCKSHAAVIDFYPGMKVRKLQCVGHVQKRVGNRLLKLKKNVKGLGGRGKLSKTVIERLQNFYGIAIRQNVGNLKEMQKACCATLFHVASSKDKLYHNAYCPPGKDSWCKYQQDIANGTQTYKHGKGLPLSVI